MKIITRTSCPETIKYNGYLWKKDYSTESWLVMTGKLIPEQKYWKQHLQLNEFARKQKGKTEEQQKPTIHIFRKLRVL